MNKKTRAADYVRMNRLNDALVLYRQVCISDPLDADAWFALGAVYGCLGDFERAVNCCREVIALRPDFADAYCNLAVACMHLGLLEDVEVACRMLTKLRPDNAHYYNRLGYVLHQLARDEEAQDSLRMALKIDPHSEDALVNYGGVLQSLDNPVEAEACFRKVLLLNPANSAAHYNLGVLASGRLDYTTAILHYRRAIQHKPDYVCAHINLGTMHLEMGNYAEAEECFRDAIRYEPLNLEARLNLANTHASLGDLASAGEMLERLNTEFPDDLDILASLSGLHEKLGDYRGAYELLRPVFESGSRHPGVINAVARVCHRFNCCEVVTEAIEQLLADADLSNVLHRTLNFTLARIYDRRGEYERAFKKAHEANSLKTVRFSPEANASYVDHLMRLYSAERVAEMPSSGQVTQRPVFIVGMPRSGTSLVEQILASHADVYGAGERNTVTEFVARLPPEYSARPIHAQSYKKLDKSLLQKMAGKYMRKTDGVSGDARRITDKMPHNFLHLGFISLLFPRARIIHCVRNPLDTCLSCYFYDFATSHPYAYDLEHLGRYYNEYQRLMRHWRDVLDLKILQVEYEELVADQELVTRRMLDFLDLEWDERCLEFYEEKRLVNTISYDQVRHPIYRQSVGRWEHYDQYLAELKHVLGVVV